MITHREAFALMAVWLVILAVCSAAAFLLGRRYGRADGEERQELAEEPGWGKRAWAEASEAIYNRPVPSRSVPQRFTGNAWPQPQLGRLSRPPRPSLSPAGERATDFIRAITAQTDAYIREMSQ